MFVDQEVPDVVLSVNRLDGLETIFKRKDYSKCALIIDEAVHRSHGEELKRKLHQLKLPLLELVVKGGETAKTMNTASELWSRMSKTGIDAKSVVLSVGGGSTSDLAGFVASTFLRGIDTIYVPTTLLAMCDASHGGKTAVNLPEGKNLVGTLHFPKCVFISLHFLETLPDREFTSGLAEVIKHGVIRDKLLFCSLEQNMERILSRDSAILMPIIQQSYTIKRDILAEEEQGKGSRRLLNFGHTFAHALETATNYALRHGEAVGIGMCLAADLSNKLRIASSSFVDRLKRLLLKASLPIKCPVVDVEQMLSLMQQDKKATFDSINLILAKDIGSPIYMPNVSRDALTWVLKPT